MHACGSDTYPHKVGIPTVLHTQRWAIAALGLNTGKTLVPLASLHATVCLKDLTSCVLPWQVRGFVSSISSESGEGGLRHAASSAQS